MDRRSWTTACVRERERECVYNDACELAERYYDIIDRYVRTTR